MPIQHYSISDIEPSDYIQLHGEEIGKWFRITDKYNGEFSCIDDFGTEHHNMSAPAIADLKLPSEMDYAF